MLSKSYKKKRTAREEFQLNGIIWIFTFIIAAQLFMIYFGGALFRTCPLAPTDLLLLVLLAATVLVWSVLVKVVLRRKYRAE